MDGDCLSLPALTGCISAGAGATVTVASGVTTVSPASGREGLMFLYTSVAAGGSDSAPVDVEPGGVGNFLADVVPGSNIRLLFNSAQTGGSAATSFDTVLVNPGDPAGIQINPADGDPTQANITTENCSDGQIVIVFDPGETDNIPLELTHNRVNSAGAGVAFGSPTNFTLTAS